MQTQQTTVSPRQVAEQKYKSARMNLLLMIAMTLFNVVMLLAGSWSVLLFSATVPYFAVAVGVMSALDIFLYPCLIFAGICLLTYFICWIFSKGHYGWMIAAMVLFIIDTLALVAIVIFSGDYSSIVDVLFHGWVLYYLVMGVKTGAQLKNMPPEEPAPVQEIVDTPAEDADVPPVVNSTHLRWADREVKHRVFLEAEVAGCRICYRRVKRINELVVNGYVYADVEMLIEPPHELSATVNGHFIQAGYSGSFSYIMVDGTMIAKKVRWY